MPSPKQQQVVQVADAAQGTIEQVSPSGHQSLSLGEPIHTDQGTMELLLGGTHKVVLNRNTTVTIATQSIAKGRQVAWRLKLTSGELYAEVTPNLPGGTRFAVTTPNALATITGTKFNIQAQDQTTELTLLKGSVRFARPGDSNPVNVTTGYASRIIGQSAPVQPKQVDATQSIAWVHSTRSTLASSAANVSNHSVDLGSDDALFAPQSLHINQIDYTTWRDENQSWFKSQFPWIFDWQKQLNEQGIKADYLDVLVASGDIWQFNSKTLKPQISQASAARLSNYFSDAKIQIHQLLSDSTDPLENINDQFSQWQHTLESDNSVDASLQLLTASAYLAKTQLGVALWAQEFPGKISVLHQLQQSSGLWPSGFEFILSDDIAQTMAARAEQCLQLRYLAQRLLMRTDEGKSICDMSESVKLSKKFVEYLKALNAFGN